MQHETLSPALPYKLTLTSVKQWKRETRTSGVEPCRPITYWARFTHTFTRQRDRVRLRPIDIEEFIDRLGGDFSRPARIAFQQPNRILINELARHRAYFYINRLIGLVSFLARQLFIALYVTPRPNWLSHNTCRCVLVWIGAPRLVADWCALTTAGHITERGASHLKKTKQTLALHRVVKIVKIV